MSDITLTQRRYSEIVSGSPKYYIELVAVNGAENTWTHSPPISPQLFVMTAVTTGVADDIFARVATLADLDLVTYLREVAVSNTPAEYRTSVITLSFDDLDTAIAAIPVVNSRVDSLVTIWNKARTDFIHAGKAYALPTGVADSSVEGAAITAYTDARDARVLAESDQTASATAYTAALTSTASTLELKDAYCLFKDDLTAISGLGGLAQTALVNATSALDTAATSLSRGIEQVRSESVNPDEAGSVNVVTCDNCDVGETPLVVNAHQGDIVLVTYAPGNNANGFGGKTVARAILSNIVDQIVVSQDLPQIAVGPDDKWSIRKLTNYLPADNFGATAAAAETARAALNTLNDSTGLIGVISTKLAAATTNCASRTTTHTTATSSERTALDTLTAAKQAKDVAQTAETTTLSDLQAVCPSKDITAL